MSIKQIIARQEEEFNKKFVFIPPAEKHESGGTLLKPYEIKGSVGDIKRWHTSSIKEILEGVGKSCCNACDCCVQLKNATKELQK